MSVRWIICTAGVFASFVFLHEAITVACDGVVRRIGFATYERTVATTVVLLALAGGTALFRRSEVSEPATRRCLVGLFAAAALAQPTLVLINIEYIHLAQYGLLAVLLSRVGLPPEGAWLGATALGAVDETYQLLFLRVGRPDRFDWNDVTFNAMGAAFGVVILLHLGLTRAQPSRHSGRTILALLAPLTAVALAIAPPVFEPFYSVTVHGFRSHELTASEGVILLGALWWGVHALIKHLARRNAGVSPTPAQTR